MAHVSIVMGVYNAETTLKVAIDSILAQSFEDWEFIIGDDASTDSTAEILKNYSEDPRFKIFRNAENVGLGATLNRCIKESSSEILTRQDADDYSLPHRLERQIKYLDENPELDVVGSLSKIVDEDNNTTGLLRVNPTPHFNEWLSGSMIIHPTVMMKKTIFEKVGGYDPKAYRIEDYDLWLRILAIGGKISSLPEVLYAYRHSFGYYKKISFGNRLLDTKYRYKNFRTLKVPFYLMIFVLRPIVGLLIPDVLHYVYYRYRFRI